MKISTLKLKAINVVKTIIYHGSMQYVITTYLYKDTMYYNSNIILYRYYLILNKNHITNDFKEKILFIQRCAFGDK